MMVSLLLVHGVASPGFIVEMNRLHEEAGTKFGAHCVEALSRVLDRQAASRTLLAV